LLFRAGTDDPALTLIYLNHGRRHYDRHPVPPYPRQAWEFQAVTHGRIQPVIPGVETASSARRLWVFPPGSTHGWTGPSGRSARVAVAHFDHVPPALAEAVGHYPLTTLPLAAARAGRFERDAARLARDFRRPTRNSLLRFDRLLIDLALLVLERCTIERPVHDESHRVVSRALGWYAARMAERPTVDDVAEAVGLSSSQLRRVFAATGADAPLAVMRRMQADRAGALLRHSDLPLDEVASTCGYGGPPSFSRGFRAITGTPDRKSVV